MLLFAFAIALALQHPAPANSGWLYLGSKTRLIRFVVASDDPLHSNNFYPVPQTSGFIFIEGETFSISVAETWGTALLEYKEGVLREGA